MTENMFEEGGLRCQVCGRHMKVLCITGDYDHGYHLCWTCHLQERKVNRRSEIFKKNFVEMMLTEKPY